MSLYKENFTTGEVSQKLWARTGLEQHANGIAEGTNTVPDVEGPLSKRAGFQMIGLSKFADKAVRWVEYIRAIDDAYMIELGDSYSRIWGSDGTYLGVDIPAPYAAADLAGLTYKQLGNVIVFFHADGRRPKRLQKVSELSWNWGNYAFRDGPWAQENINQAITLTCSNFDNFSGDITVTSVGYSFTLAHVGTSLRLRGSTGLPGLKSWAADVTETAGHFVLSNGRAYTSGSNAKTGNTPPSHDLGTISDGVVPWTYVHDNSGEILITAYVNATTVMAHVVRRLPTTGDATQHDVQPVPLTTFLFSEQVYSDAKGWPTAWPELRGERLVVGGGRQTLDKYYTSQTAGYYADEAVFTPGLGTGTVLDDDAITGFVGDDSFKVVWFAATSMLMAGTQGGESVIVGETAEAALSPSTAQPRRLSGHSAAAARPAKVQDGIVFIQRSRKAIRARTVSPYDYPGTSQDLSFIARHIAKRGFAEIVYAGEPDYQLWTRLQDGGLASFVFNQEQNIKGWTRQQLGGGFLVESINVLPDVEGNERLWIVAVRTKDGAAQRVLMRSAIRAEPYRVDGFKRVTGSDLTAVTGLGALEGETVRLMAGDGLGGYVQYTVTVNSGVATLPPGISAPELVCGLPYLMRFESLPLTAEGRDGQTLRIISADIEADMVTAKVGTNGSKVYHLENERLFEALSYIYPEHRVFEVNMPDDDGSDPRIVIEDDSGFDLVIKAYNLNIKKGSS